MTQDTEQSDMVERMADVLAKKVDAAVEEFPGTDEQKRAIRARTVEKLNESVRA